MPEHLEVSKMKRVRAVLILGVFLLVVATAIPTAGAVSTIDAMAYFDHKSWSGVDNYAIYKSLRPLVGSKTIGPLYTRIPWDRLDVASVGIMIHGDLYPLKENTSKYFVRVTDIGATDYNRGAYITIDGPWGTSGYEKYGISFSQISPYFIPKRVGRIQKADTRGIKKVFIVQASSKEEAKQKVETGLSFGFSVGEGLQVGVDYTINTVYEMSSSTSISKTYGVIVTFHNYIYRAEVEYRGYLTRTVSQNCPGGFCPTSLRPDVRSQKGATPLGSYQYSDFKQFNLDSGAMFFVGYDQVYGTSSDTLSIIFEQEVR